MPSFYKKPVDFADTNSFSTLVLDYLASSERLDQFLSFSFNSDAFKKKIEQRTKQEVNRVLLKEVISEQYKKMSGVISVSPEVDKNISVLDKPTTFTVITGHQLNLFTGPLFFIYKIISTIKLADTLKKTFPEYQFVPVYWMASEDHDLEEINHIHLFGKKIGWEPAMKGASGKIGSAGIPEVIEQVKTILGSNPQAEKIISLFSKAYSEKNNLATATRIISHELFSKYGLVILDADDARLKKLFIDEMKDDAVNHTAYKLVNETISQLEENYKTQVHPREINLFYLADNSRERIVEENNSFTVLNSSVKFSKEELLNEIGNHPEKFSPNVVLRPLYQEKILPNLAYIGGPAEISYWMEYKKMFQHYGAELPVLVLRSCFMIMDAAARDKLKKLGLEPEDVILNEEDLVKKYLKLKSSQEFSIDSLLSKADSLFNETITQVNEIDPTLKATVEAEKQKMMNGLKALEGRIQKAEKKKHETAINQIRKLREKFFPENKLQERYENLLTYYSKYGDAFLDELLKQSDPFEKKFIILTEE